MRKAKAEHVEQPSFNAIRSVALPREARSISIFNSLNCQTYARGDSDVQRLFGALSNRTTLPLRFAPRLQFLPLRLGVCEFAIPWLRRHQNPS
jgi:hypothetical protein